MSAVTRSGCFERQPPADRRAVVHDVHGEALDPEPGQQAVDQLGVVVEGVGEGRPVRHVALAVARIVRRDHAVAVGERRDQVAEHVRGGREAVQQQHDRRVGRPRLAVEDAHAVDRDGPVVGDRDGAGRGRRCRVVPGGRDVHGMLILAVGWFISTRRAQVWAMPPSTKSSAPLTKLLSSDARKTAAAAISSGLPIRPSGVWAAKRSVSCRSCSASGASPCSPGVEVAPGESTLTRMPVSFRSRIQLRARLRIAALVAE